MKILRIETNWKHDEYTQTACFKFTEDRHDALFQCMLLSLPHGLTYVDDHPYTFTREEFLRLMDNPQQYHYLGCSVDGKYLYPLGVRVRIDDTDDFPVV